MSNLKSNRLLVVSRLVGIIGVFICMLAAIIYLLLLVGGDASTFDPNSIYIIAGMCVLFVCVSVLIRMMSNRVAAAEAETEDDVDLDEVVEDAVDEVLESYDDVAETAEGFAEAVEDAVVETAPAQVATSGLQLTPEKKEKIVKTVKKNAPVILAVVATATVSAMVYGAAKNRRKAKIRKSILDLLY